MHLLVIVNVKIAMWKSLKYDSSFVQFSKAIFKHRNPPAVGLIYFQLSLIQGKAEIDKFKFEGTCVKVPNSTMLSIVDVQSEFYQFVFHQWDSRCEPVGSERRLLIRFSSSPLDLCLFVPCFPAFFDLLISLGQ